MIVMKTSEEREGPEIYGKIKVEELMDNYWILFSREEIKGVKPLWKLEIRKEPSSLDNSPRKYLLKTVTPAITSPLAMFKGSVVKCPPQPVPDVTYGIYRLASFFGYRGILEEIKNLCIRLSGYKGIKCIKMRDGKMGFIGEVIIEISKEAKHLKGLFDVLYRSCKIIPLGDYSSEGFSFFEIKRVEGK